MTLSIKLAGNKSFYVETDNRVLGFLLDRFIKVRVSHVSAMGRCGWIEYRNMNSAQLNEPTQSKEEQ